MTKQEALSRTALSPSTIFTKEDVQRLIDAIDVPEYQHPMQACPCAADGFTTPCTAEAPKLLTDLDIEDIANDIAEYIASNADGILDIDNAELSLDYNRTVQVDSCPIDEQQLAEQITDQLVKQLAKRGLYQDAV